MYQLQYTIEHIKSGVKHTNHSFFLNKEVLIKKLNRWNDMSGLWKYTISIEDKAKNSLADFLRYLPCFRLMWTGEYEHEYIFNKSTYTALKI